MQQQAVGLIDPAVDNNINLGDHIISQAVRDSLRDRCGIDQPIRFASIYKLSREDYRTLRTCRTVFVGGTNLLSSNMNSYNQWKINLWDTLRLGRVVLCGVGWWQYQSKPNLYTRMLLTRVLDPHYVHSVRDEYTKRQLASIGIHNVVNTCCPTTWGITEEVQAAIPEQKATDVVCTLTCYNKEPELDKAILETLRSNYARVYFWPQGNDDSEYLRQLNVVVSHLPREVSAFDAFLDDHPNVDYVGTRLHAGIRAIQHRKRCLILQVDNRAGEIARDIGLNVIGRASLAQIQHWIATPRATALKLPWREILQWSQQEFECDHDRQHRSVA